MASGACACDCLVCSPIRQDDVTRTESCSMHLTITCLFLSRFCCSVFCAFRLADRLRHGMMRDTRVAQTCPAPFFPSFHFHSPNLLSCEAFVPQPAAPHVPCRSVPGPLVGANWGQNGCYLVYGLRVGRREAGICVLLYILLAGEEVGMRCRLHPLLSPPLLRFQLSTCCQLQPPDLRQFDSREDRSMTGTLGLSC